MMKTYEKIVKERMVNHIDSDLVGGSFRGKSYPHILKDLSNNFIDSSYPEKKCLKGSLTNDNIKYHYAEHLNSSQTMCIAFFKKFFESEANEHLLSTILTMLNIDISDTEIIDAIFEYIPCSKEGTNFDFYLRLKNGKQLTWEIKFTESEFGRIPPVKAMSKTYLDKWNNVYLDMLSQGIYSRCFLKTELSIIGFYEHYQIMRNILYAKNTGDYVLFLTPKENNSKALIEGRAFIDVCATTCNTKCIRNIYWEDLLDATLKVVENNTILFDYYSKFKTKYFE